MRKLSLFVLLTLLMLGCQSKEEKELYKEIVSIHQEQKFNEVVIKTKEFKEKFPNSKVLNQIEEKEKDSENIIKNGVSPEEIVIKNNRAFFRDKEYTGEYKFKFETGIMTRKYFSGNLSKIYYENKENKIKVEISYSITNNPFIMKTTFNEALHNQSELEINYLLKDFIIRNSESIVAIGELTSESNEIFSKAEDITMYLIIRDEEAQISTARIVNGAIDFEKTLRKRFK